MSSIEELQNRFREICKLDLVESKRKPPREHQIYYLESLLSDCRKAGKYVKDEDDRKKLLDLSYHVRNHIRDHFGVTSRHLEYMIEMYDPRMESSTE